MTKLIYPLQGVKIENKRKWMDSAAALTKLNANIFEVKAHSDINQSRVSLHMEPNPIFE